MKKHIRITNDGATVDLTGRSPAVVFAWSGFGDESGNASVIVPAGGAAHGIIEVTFTDGAIDMPGDAIVLVDCGVTTLVNQDRYREVVFEVPYAWSVPIAAAVWQDANANDFAVAGSIGETLRASAPGGIATTITVKTTGGATLQGVSVRITSDQAGARTIANGTTDINGEVVFELPAGSYYVWRQLAGENFSNPQSISVS